MTRASLAAALPLALLASAPAPAQDAPLPPVVVQSGPQVTPQRPVDKSVRFAGDSLARYEWTDELPDAAAAGDQRKRWRIQARPRLEMRIGPIEAGVGGEFNYSQDRNDELVNGEPVLVQRDNYRSREARLDLAYGRLDLGIVSAQGGRFLMPLPLTEMTWDADLRPQGGSATLSFGAQGTTRIAATGLYAKGSHVFEDESVLYGGGVTLHLVTGPQSALQLSGSYLQFEDLDRLDPAIRRQNTRLEGAFVHDYRVVSVNARLAQGGQMPLLLVADYCWNTSLEEGNRGLWLAATLGSIEVSRLRAEYVYAKVDRDATVAAFATDDFLWGTGWAGHRVTLSTAASHRSTLSAIAQWQRFKDSPIPEVADSTVKRYRIEMKTTF